MSYYKRVDKNGKTYTVEEYSHDKPIEGAIEIEQAEYDAFIASLPEPEPVVTRYALQELDALKAELKAKGIIGSD